MAATPKPIGAIAFVSPRGDVSVPGDDRTTGHDGFAAPTDTEPAAVARTLCAVAATPWRALLVQHRARSFAIAAPTSATTGSTVCSTILCNGAPLVGGVVPLRHGDWLTIGTATGVRRLWLSCEGPRTATPARQAGIDALSLQDIAVGDPVVTCGCGAVYLLDTWLLMRRCCRCGQDEPGSYRELPPGCCAGRGGAA